MTDLIIQGINMLDRRTIELMRAELACISRDECDRHCENCDLVQDVDELTTAFREVVTILEALSNAVQLPEGYGKLIDIKDVESEKFHIEGRAEMYSAYNIGWNDALDTVCKNAHSIVPAEGGANND